RTFYYPNWAESFYRPLPATNIQGVGFPEGFKVIFAGNLGEAQSLETIVAAAGRLKGKAADIHWIMVGYGRRCDWMQQQVQRLGLERQVHFPGRFPAAAMPEFFAHADALLVTLKSDDVFAQTIPSKVQSYMACAKPVLAALNGEGARVIEEAAGIAVAAENDHALAEAVLELYHMPAEQRLAMGNRGRDYYNRCFERNMLVKKLEQWMVEVKEEGLCES
ncbi:MAG: glycosyltransferase family 4 protein, partial [Mariprofundus sp.]